MLKFFAYCILPVISVGDSCLQKIVVCQEDDDLPYEEDILRNPFSIKCWLRYIEHKRQTCQNVRSIYQLYERALHELPGSYKLWYEYLSMRQREACGFCITDPIYEEVNHCFKRALIFMHKMPRIWLEYCEFMIRQRLITKTRNVFDQALRALPVTQHDRIWPLYLKFVQDHNIPETAVRVFRRYLKLFPEESEAYVEYLKSIDRLDEAAQRLATIVNDEGFVSREGKTNHQLWQDLCDLIAKNPDKVTSLKVEPIIRQGIKMYTDQVGSLWCSLADYYIRGGHFEKARDIYEEAAQTVVTVRDFTQVFDAYAQFMELLISSAIADLQKHNLVDNEQDAIELDLMMARFENLMDRRPLLLNSILLRQNPHNVHEWHKRVDLLKDDEKKVIETFTEAVHTVDPKLQVGKLYTLWVRFAKFYEKNGQLDDARQVFEQALKVSYTKVEDLAAVYCQLVEMELRNKNVKNAYLVIKRAVTPPAAKVHYFDQASLVYVTSAMIICFLGNLRCMFQTEPVQNRVYRSLKIWSLFADMEESFGTFESCKAVYDRIIEMRIATPQMIINYGLFLEEHKFFEEAFRAYEKGIALFKWPNVYEIWNNYLIKFMERYGGKKLERARDLFEQCLENCPPEFAKVVSGSYFDSFFSDIYLLYAKLEEEYGLGRHAMNIYNRATEAVTKDEMYSVFNIYIKKAAEIYGVTQTRPIYEKAVAVLPDNHAREMCLRFAELERKLGEIDRARAIYAHCSSMCDPRIHEEFWQVWKEFEVKHGNEDTVREMLRIKRSVQATYNTQINFMSAQMLAAASGQMKTSMCVTVVCHLLTAMFNLAEEMTAGDSMALLEAKAQQLAEEASKGGQKSKVSAISFISGETMHDQHRGAGTRVVEERNPDEIDLDMLNELEVEKQTVPSEVFGNLANDEEVT
ncbi:unnamed protein product [Soboliphyme baturini]|uniref:Pre-mRNA-splicing factor SYF1 n=1 Tax=Soboliphyme baturini TaxID=241478 RepID=A0A183IBJ3_9BILA|nr:unnamed protein product [Soboliphyme baturini]